MASPSVGELSPELCCTDSKTFELLKHIQREIQGYAPFVLPLVLLLGFGVVFAGASLGGSMLGFDDHPGQLYRVWHVMTYGPAPWAWDRGWWAGYPELQFYPPGFAYLGALLAWPTTGVLDIGTVYQTLLWLAYLLPGVTTYVVLAAYARAPWTARTREALRALALAAALTAFWTLPLLFRLAETRALAWGTLSTAPFARPLPVLLAALALASLLDRTPARGERL